ncbi:MAG: helix-turn-helix transcriptional regulator [Clostridia bacterium]|nr:helix-turn-helix transcriptional regulator [Clostridia bacterium]
MPIIVNLDVMMAKRKVGVSELASRVGITLSNLSILKNNRAKAIRFSTLCAICAELNCQPGDLLEYVPGDEDTDGKWTLEDE